MWICCPFFHGDAHLAKALLSWIKQLDGNLSHGALLVVDSGTDWSIVSECLQIAASVFQRVEIITTGESWGSWPAGPNALFKCAAQFFEGRKIGPWFWCEPDACPIHKGWIDTLQADYLTAGKLFMGCLTPSLGITDTANYLPGCSVYPWNAWSVMSKAWDECKAFDMATAKVTIPLAVHTERIQHFWGRGFGEKHLAPTFKEKKEPGDPVNTFTLKSIKPEAVVFHANKDGTLLKLLGFRDDSFDISFFQMGRYGDLILLLPAFKEWADRIGHPVTVFTSRQFGDVFEGVSYVEPVLLRQDWWHQTKEALDVAKRTHPDVFRTQLHGAGLDSVPDNLASFSLSMWDRAGLLPFYKKLPLVFDRRNFIREMALIKRVKKTNKPLLLYNAVSWTSHLGPASELIRAINRTAQKFEIVNIGILKADRIFDLLGLFDVAAGMVTIDTASLHLAAASKMPYIAIVRDDPTQSGSIPKGNCVMKVGYGQVVNKLSEITATIESWA